MIKKEVFYQELLRYPLSPDQVLTLWSKYRNRKSYTIHVFDGRLYDYLMNLNLPQSIKNALTESIKDERCTKRSVDWSQIEEQVKDYGNNRKPVIYLRSFKLAVRLLEELVPRVDMSKMYESVRTLDPLKVWSNPDGSAGAVGAGTKLDNIEAIQKLAQQMLPKILDGENPKVPCVLLKRTQLSKLTLKDSVTGDIIYNKDFKVKYRPVWCVDGGTNLLECSVFQRIIDHFSAYVSFYAGGKSPEILASFFSGSFTWNYSYSFDMSRYDQTVPGWLIKWIAWWLAWWFYPNNREARQLTMWAGNGICETDIILPSGRVLSKQDGIDSGSNGTQLFGTVAHFLITCTTLFHFLIEEFNKYSDDEIFSFFKARYCYAGNLKARIMSDDIIWLTNNPINVERYAQYIWGVFGVKVNAEKSEHGMRGESYPEFLKSYWTERGRVRELTEHLIQLIHPEFSRTYENYHPSHILYGSYVTYIGSWSGILDEEVLLRDMKNYGSIEQLSRMPLRELPGSLRGLGRIELTRIVRRAKALSA